jgi:hypothetical protein
VLTGKCAICERDEVLTRHHLIPQARHHNKKNKRDFDRKTVKRTVGICRPCHSQIHAIFTEKQLEREWNSIEKLKSHSAIAEFAAWISTKPPGFRCQMKKSYVK